MPATLPLILLRTLIFPPTSSPFTSMVSVDLIIAMTESSLFKPSSLTASFVIAETSCCSLPDIVITHCGAGFYVRHFACDLVSCTHRSCQTYSHTSLLFPSLLFRRLGRHYRII